MRRKRDWIRNRVGLTGRTTRRGNCGPAFALFLVLFLASDIGTFGMHVWYDHFDGEKRLAILSKRNALLAQAKEGLAWRKDEVGSECKQPATSWSEHSKWYPSPRNFLRK